MKFGVICVILLVFVSGSLSVAKTVHATTPPLRLDGIGTSTGHCCYTASQSQLLTTTIGHDVILLVVEWEGQGLGVRDRTGLSFVQRIEFKPQPSLFCAPSCPALTEYYAISNAPLRSDNITAIVSNSSGCCPTIFGMQVIGVSGANARVTFDSNPSVPTLVSCPFLSDAYACTSPGFGECLANGFGTCSASIQTSTFDFVIAVTAINDAPSCGGDSALGLPIGFTNIASPNSRFEVDYLVTQTPRTGVLFNCNGTDSFAIVLDAISFFGAFGSDT